MNTIELKDRELIPIQVHPYAARLNHYHVGVALDHDEAQKFYDMGLRVFGDANGPYLVTRLPHSQTSVNVWDPKHVDVEIEARVWVLSNSFGTICWLKSAN